jgi:hypothetical protein
VQVFVRAGAQQGMVLIDVEAPGRISVMVPARSVPVRVAIWSSLPGMSTAFELKMSNSKSSKDRPGPFSLSAPSTDRAGVRSWSAGQAMCRPREPQRV